MRFLAGLRVIFVAAAMIGLLAGQAVVSPQAVTHAAMATTDTGGHDCCGKTSNTPMEKAGLAGVCLGLGCSLIAPAVLPATPTVALKAERLAERASAVAGLEGRSPPPPLEPPRA